MTVAQLDEVKGVLKKTICYRNGWFIGALESGDKVKNPSLPFELEEGREYVFRGSWENDPKWGDQFVFVSCQPIVPVNLESIQHYLDRAKWIGKKISRLLIDHYGVHAIEMCKELPAQVADDIPGITLERALDIQRKLLDSESEEKLRVELGEILSGVKIRPQAISEILKKWGPDAPAQIREDPYQLVGFSGIAFKTADQIAKNAGFNFEDPRRVRAGCLAALTDAAFNGHTCLPRWALAKNAGALLFGYACTTEQDRLLWSCVNALCEDEAVVSSNDMFSIKSTYDDELFIAQKLRKLGGPRPRPAHVNYGNLEPDQRLALDKALTHGVLILTGAPGTGKTTTIKQIVDAFPGSMVKVAAPTGKAAKRVFEQTGREASTIHRLLEPQMPDGKTWDFARNEENPIEASLIILDEVSMVDVWLMARFLEAVAPGVRLILVGDSYQLPSVGAGNVLRDLLGAGTIASQELVTFKRQNPGVLLQNIHRVKRGEMIENGSGTDDFHLLALEEEEDIQRTIVNLVVHQIPKLHSVDPTWDVQVIVPRRTERIPSCLVAHKMNAALQHALNPHGEPAGWFRIGDKVIQIKNEYNVPDVEGVAVSLLNGDIGELLDPAMNLELRRVEMDKNEAKKLRGETLRVLFRDPDRIVDVSMDDHNLELAYAITGHKMQGSEAKVVVIPMHRNAGPLVLQRNWFYTAISRAKEQCYLVGQPSEIAATIGRVDQSRRFTQLKELCLT
jgi:exodeoxyribonuclease V alpha subunit